MDNSESVLLTSTSAWLVMLNMNLTNNPAHSPEIYIKKKNLYDKLVEL